MSHTCFRAHLLVLGLLGCVGAPLLAAELQSRVWLLGEVHDNPHGHQARHAWLEKRVAGGWRPAIVMEQFDREHQPLLDQVRRTCRTATCITSQTGLEGWDWPLYEPVLQLALDYSLPLLAANVSRTDVNRIVRNGYSAALPQQVIKHYRLDQPLPSGLLQLHKRNIAEGHCNLLPDAIAESMVPAQVARDVWMAWVVEQQAEKTDVVLLAGNGHVLRDVGVIQWLSPELKSKAQVVGFVESPQAYNAAQFDVIHPIAEISRPDPCEVFKAGKH